MIINKYENSFYELVKNWGITKAYSKVKYRKRVRNIVNVFNKGRTIFSQIEIETINRCNGTCSFCPVNARAPQRELAIMNDELFKKIIDNLVQMQYKGRICLFSNNEPFLDKSMPEKIKYTKHALPDAKLIIYSNGTVLSNEQFIEIIPFVDGLYIDNYNDELVLNPASERINELCKKDEEWDKKVFICIRKEHEIMTSRGGEAPNRKASLESLNCGCYLPYEQIVIRPTGLVSLCCNDALGKMTLGDVNKNTLEEIWFSDQYIEVRKKLEKGRKKSGIGLCKYCDNLF